MRLQCHFTLEATYGLWQAFAIDMEHQPMVISLHQCAPRWLGGRATGRTGFNAHCFPALGLFMPQALRRASSYLSPHSCSYRPSIVAARMPADNGVAFGVERHYTDG